MHAFVIKDGVVTGIGRGGDCGAPPTMENKLVITWKLESNLEFVDLDTVLRARVFALQLPRIGMTDQHGAPVGNMLSYMNNRTNQGESDSLRDPSVIERNMLLPDRAIVFTCRVHDVFSENCWPQIFCQSCQP